MSARDWETTAVGLADENARIAAALAALWEWAVAHQITQHADDGDTIAATIVGLVQAALVDASHVADEVPEYPEYGSHAFDAGDLDGEA